MRNKHELKIQINSKEALDRLIGDDPELKIEVQKAVLGNYMKLHVKPLITEDLNKKMMKETLKEVVDKYDWGDIKLSEKVNDSIKKGIEKNLRPLIFGMVTEVLKERKDEIEEKVINAVISGVRSEVRIHTIDLLMGSLNEEIRNTASEVFNNVLKGKQNE